jgi:YteA family regulatory protein
LDKKDLKHYEELLNREKKSKEDSLENESTDPGISLRDQTGELSSYDNHPGDLGNETFEAEKDFSFKTRDKFLLSEIQAALHRIADGTYGLCELCHKEIDNDRLEIMPYSRLCVNCEKNVGDKVQNEERERPIEEQVLFPPFGRSFTDNSVEDKVEYDGEDTWESVNEYNVRMSDNESGEDESIGYVEDVEQISNKQYRKQVE